MPFDPGYDDRGLLGCVVICLALLAAFVVLVVIAAYGMLTS